MASANSSFFAQFPVWSPLNGLDASQFARVEEIRQKRHPLLKLMMMAAATIFDNTVHNNLVVSKGNAIDGLFKDPSNTFIFVSNHETHKDYLEQMVYLNSIGRLPVACAGENLFRIGDKAVKGIGGDITEACFGTFCYRQHRIPAPKRDHALRTLEKHMLMSGNDILKYPAGGLSRDGSYPPFGVSTFLAVAEAYFLAREAGLSRNIYVAPLSIRHEIVLEFGLYEKIKSTGADKDISRWMENLKTTFKMPRHKGDTYLALPDPIAVSGVAELHPLASPRELAEILAYQSLESVLEVSPLLKTDLVFASMPAHALERECFQFPVAEAYSGYDALLNKCANTKVRIAPELQRLLTPDAFGQTLDLLSRQGNSVISIQGKDMRIHDPYAAKRYRNRALQLIEHHGGA